MISVIERLRYSADRCFDKTALVHDEQRLTYAQVYAAIQATARYLTNQGIQKGDKVAICQRNSPSFVINFYAIMALGACAVLLNWRLTQKELFNAMEQTDCTAALCDNDFIDSYFELIANNGEAAASRLMIPVTQLGLAPQGLFDAPAALAQLNDQVFAALDGSNDALVFFTGGSTGSPKAAVHCHSGLSNWVDATLNNVWTVCSSDVMLNPAPLFHLGGMQVLLFALSVGATVVLTGRSFDAAAALNLVEAERVTQVNLIPQTLIHGLLEESRRKKRDLSSVRLALLMGGTACEEYVRSAFELFENACVVHPYGMSELAATAIMLHTRESFEQCSKRRLSVGRIGLGSRIKLVDDNGNPVSSGEPGRVFGKANCMMKGYMNHAIAYDAEGYFDTGDIMQRDEDGYYYYVGRNKLLIKTGGENVYCNEVESTIRLHPAVYNCVVFGLPDKKWDEAVSTAIELKPGHTATAEEIIAHCREHAAHYKQPRNVFFVEKLPLNPAGKILINEVLALLGLNTK